MIHKQRWIVGLIVVASLSGFVVARSISPAGHADGSVSGSACRISVPVTPSSISPDIYGMAVAPLQTLTNACVPLNRWGGNTACRYNWKLGNAWNTGNDWFFQNVAVERNAWQGFLRRAEKSGGRALVTLPLVGYVAKDTSSAAFSVHTYGPQQKADPHRTDAGNGVRLDGTPVTGNDRFDTSVVADPPFVAAWVRQMAQEFPRLFAEHRIVFALGNEPMLWNITHRDVHPNPVSYDEYLERFVAMAHAVRQVAPGALIAGPELWGWPAYFQSALDRETKTGRDRASHGGEDFLPWFLKQMKAHEDRTGERLLDILTVHFYPQAEGVHAASTDLKATVLRVETTRSLFDPAYRDPSWINERVELIPRLKRWVARYYPGLKTGITEYNWGGEEDISGALALADILGIFGREGLDLACYWTYPPEGSPTAAAYALYRNADGCGAAFGNTRLDVTWLAPATLHDSLSVYAARDEAAKIVTLMVVNKSALTQTAQIEFKGMDLSPGNGYRVDSHGVGIEAVRDVIPVQGSMIRIEFPPRSIHHLRFPEKP
ncbi:MAG: glycoside hydrolase family 44 protein [bacterium]